MTAAQLYLPNRPFIAGSNFDLTTPRAKNQARGGWHQDVFMGAQLWTCEISTTELSKALAGQYKWLKAIADDSDQTIYLYDPERAHPLLYGPGGGWGNPTITAVSYANGTINLSGLTPNAVISPGDYGHWDDGPARRLHICEGAKANGSGVITGMKVRPRPPATVTASLPVPFVMAKAAAEMKIIKMDAPFKAPVTSQVSLTAVQVIRRY